jgi:hypothetical protein
MLAWLWSRWFRRAPAFKRVLRILVVERACSRGSAVALHHNKLGEWVIARRLEHTLEVGRWGEAGVENSPPVRIGQGIVEVECGLWVHVGSPAGREVGRVGLGVMLMITSSIAPSLTRSPL